MSWRPNSKANREETLRRVTKHINDHNLVSRDNSRVIIPDAKLSQIVRVPRGQQLTFFNLEHCIEHNYYLS